MDFVRKEFWGILLNVTGSFLWASTIFYFFMRKVKERRKNPKECGIANQKDFNDEIFSQLIKQQADNAFSTISLTIKNERRSLAELIESSGELNKKARMHPEDKHADVPKKRSLQTDKMKQIALLSRGKDRYAEVLRLADRGMTTRKISEKVKIPKGEIDMLVSLRSRRRRHAERKAAG